MVNPPSSSGQPLGAQPVTNQTSWGYGYTTNQVAIGNINYQPTPTGIPYPSNTFTSWGKPNWSDMLVMGGIPIHTAGAARGPPYRGPPSRGANGPRGLDGFPPYGPNGPGGPGGPGGFPPNGPEGSGGPPPSGFGGLPPKGPLTIKKPRLLVP